MNEFFIFAHRGAMGSEPENTIIAFEKAVEAGAKWIETDIYALENELIVIHDERLERTTDGSGYFPELSLEYVRSVDTGKGQKIPTLDEVLDLLAGKCSLNLELKGPETAELTARKIKNAVESKKWDYNNFLVSSFNHHELLRFKNLLPEVRIGALTMSIPLNYSDFARDLKAWSIHVSNEFINKEFVNHAHKNGLKLFVYTVNYEDDLNRLRDMGIDGIFTDYPEKFCKL